MSQALSDTAAWPRLRAYAQALSSQHLRDLFAADPQRVERCTLAAAGLELDYSKQRIDPSALDLLLELAREQGLEEWIPRLFAGEAINHTEQRAALHVALRAPRASRIEVDGRDVIPEVHAVLDRLCAFAQDLRGGSWLGATAERISDVVNIGIGGSDLGPRMVCEALADFADGPRTHFVANVDGAQISAVLKHLRPQSTLFAITSKTFTTQETMANAGAARRWLVEALGEGAIPKHFVAVSTNRPEVERFGIRPDNMFGFWDWVGGRYSLWSAVGLPIVVALGAPAFRELLAGAHAMDEHFRDTPLERNLPVLLALLALWNRNALHAPTQVIAPYAQRLEKFVHWLQQLEMESNGKRVTREGRLCEQPTTPALWGDVGSCSQHAFFQMLHQGAEIHPVDFILAIEAGHALVEQQRLLIANCLAQAASLMRGKTADEVRAELSGKGLQGEALEAAIPHRVFPGNRPSNMILMPRLDPFHLGALLALYEHRTFVLSVLWNVNAFDQWGVELGKQLAQELLKPGAQDNPELDASTRALLRRIAGTARAGDGLA